jgi:uncharacterized repeat protein (TIGR01451 family)
MKRNVTTIGFCLGLGAVATVALLWLLGVGFPVVKAQGPDSIDTYYVAPGGSCGTGISPCYASVQAAVDATDDPGDVVKVAAGTYTGVQGRPAPDWYDGPSVITQAVYISRTVTIQGGYTTANWAVPDPVANPTTLDALEQGRVFFIAGDINPTIDGLRITGGNATGLVGDSDHGADAGGGVCVINASATINDNLVFSNTAAFGGGLYMDESSDVMVSGNTIISNTASDRGGGLYMDDTNGVTLSGNTISFNIAANDVGGGVCVNEDDGITLSGNTIVSNTSGLFGGGMLLRSNGATVSGNTILSNTANLHGGGLDLSGDVTLSGNTIMFNAAERGGGVLLFGDATVSGNTILSNTATLYGGGLYLDGDVKLINNVVADNRADNAGSGLYIAGSSSHLLHNTIARNTSGDGTGIVTSPWVPTTVALTNTILVSHTVGIHVSSGSTVQMEATLWGSGDWANGTDWSGAGTIMTGTVNVRGDPAFVDPANGDYHIGSASAARDAGVVAGIGQDVDGQIRPMDQGYDIGADEYPGVGLDIVKHPSEAFLNPGQQFSYTIVVTSVGTENATGVVLTDTLDDWQRPLAAASSLGGCSVTDGNWGGTVVCTPDTIVTGTAVVVTLTAQVSTAVPLGQAMVNTVVVTANETANSGQATTYAQDCHVRINDDPKEYTTVQAAIDAASSNDIVKIAGRCMGVNTRGELRQQVYLDKSLTLRGGYTTTNWTTSDPEANPTTLDALGKGRAIYITAGVEPTIEELRITGGHTTDSGGGIYNGGTLTLTNSAVSGNTADGDGGGICNGGTLILTNSTVSDNTASDSGGGIGDDGGSLILITDTKIYANTAANGEGGGIYVGDGSHLSMSRSWVVGNAAPDNDAGGIAARGDPEGSGSTAYIENSIIAGNMSDGSGGGLTLGYGGPYRIVNSHIVGNETSGEGAAMAATYSVQVELTNTLIISNTGNTGIADRDDSGSVFLLNYCDTYGNSPDGTDGVTVSRTHCLGTPAEDGVDPLMSGGALPGGVGPAFAAQWMSYDYSLQVGSPAIDAGTPIGAPATDIDGEPRLGAPDLGADEYWAPGALKRVYLPLVLRQYP